MQEKTMRELKWIERYELLRAEANLLEPGAKKDKLLMQARQLKLSTEIDRWLSSANLRAPR